MHILLYLTVVLLALSYKFYKWFSLPESLKKIPIISFKDFLLSLIRGESIEERERNQRKGPLYNKGYACFWQQGRWEIMTANAEQIKYIFNRTDIFLKRPELETTPSKMLIQKFFGNSNILFTDNEEWKRHRRVINPAFKKSWSIEIFGNSVLEMISAIEQKEDRVILVRPLFQKLTIDVLGKGLFSYEFEAIKNGEKSPILNTYNRIMEGIFSPLYFLMPSLEDMPWRKYYHQKNEEFRLFIKDIMKERLNEIKVGQAKDDIISLMLKSRLECNEESLTDEEIINNIASFFLAGHDTTANTLTSTLFYLAKHPEIQDKVREEVIRVMGNNKNIFPSLEQQKEFTYMSCVIKESMRIITTLPGLIRYCNKDEILPDGLFVPKGTFINPQLWALHHNPKLFPNPDVFNPDRFLDSKNEQSSNFMAFGGGTRLCAGISFTLMEQKIALALLLQNYKMEFGPNYKNLDKPKLQQLGFIYPINLDIRFINRD